MNNKRKRLRRRRKLAKGFKRTLRAVLLAPGRIPPIDLKTVEICMRVCEICGIIFVMTLIAHLISESSILTGLTFTMGFAFMGLMFFIKLADYQDKLIRMQMADYIYIR
ncbi:MAG: hypothetical protein SPH91_01960 [Lachnospiraceae bacterium]|jgi:hypothetical protein|nr:hypothetical protein [Lachnospiraceae bacterium]MCI6331963.1 hypothetical protein [Lachnospiraceae bacterium]MCI6408538.1 hypothetical protein [Lachnospiraceae bacterium]MCI6666046.1 hypothetical protein [Lachnospiraceae bacterium]MCI6978441.1 hypothetical protein [Lachnospiraceae bacterium]